MATDKKRTPILLFVGVFAAIVVLVITANRKSGLVYELRFPQNAGVAYLSGHADKLAAVCHDGKVYVWDWNQLSARPVIVEAQSDQAVLLKSNRVVSVRSSNATKIVVQELDNGKVYKDIPFSAEGKQARLAISRNGETVVVMLADAGKGTGTGDQEIALVDCNAGLVRPVAKLAKASGDRIMSLAVSNGGGLAVLAGEKSGQGYMACINIEQKQLVWAVQLPDLKKVRNAVFSKDDKVIYIRGTDSAVQLIDTQSGKVLKQLLPISENKSTAGDQHVQIPATSDDGCFMAASITSSVYLWDCKTEKVVLVRGPGHKLVSGITFSPDSKFFATSDSRQGGTIKIWRTPKH